MHASSDLAKLHRIVQRRLVKMKCLYRLIPRRPPEERGILIAVSVIELDNIIISGLREFTVSTLMRARTLSGHRISTNRSVGSMGEASAFILSILNSVRYFRMKAPVRVTRREEPTVRDPKDTEKIMINCKASNIGSLQNALAFNFTVFRDIGTVRNFYAHRNEDTASKVRAKARSLGVPAAHHADHLVQAPVAGRPVPLFEDWVREAELFFEELVR